MDLTPFQQWAQYGNAGKVYAREALKMADGDDVES